MQMQLAGFGYPGLYGVTGVRAQTSLRQCVQTVAGALALQTHSHAFVLLIRISLFAMAHLQQC
jgi:hypothetical protein